ncbi:Gfo/Idh/MocA family oxidoreductase [Desulfococcaceae bacterium HSG9]|nr:Gfo/Idh/MocA family oxidoreductase [Desulfococcaceae bacterium HSG9]
MNKLEINIAQFGAGYWGPNLIRNFIQSDGVNEFTVCDLNPDRLNKMKQIYPDIKVTQSPDHILNNPQVDAVIVAIPAALHYDIAKKALLAKKHVLVEKPLAMTAPQAKELADLSEKTGKVLMVGHTFLYNDAVRKAKDYIKNGELGEIYYIHSQRLNLGRVREDINVMWNLAPHDISIILYWMEETPSSVCAKGLTFLQDDIEDVVFLDLKFPSGCAAHIHVSWLAPRKTREIIVVGSKKMLIYDDVSSESKIMIYDKGIDKKRIIRHLPDIDSFGQFQMMRRSGDIFIPKINFREPLRMECQHFIDCIRNGTTPMTDGRNGLDVVSILDSAQQHLDKLEK